MFSIIWEPENSWPTIAKTGGFGGQFDSACYPAAIFGRGRRERRGAGEEKEEGLLRTVD